LHCSEDRCLNIGRHRHQIGVDRPPGSKQDNQNGFGDGGRSALSFEACLCVGGEYLGDRHQVTA
jgi:hypothetical protein